MKFNSPCTTVGSIGDVARKNQPFACRLIVRLLHHGDFRILRQNHDRARNNRELLPWDDCPAPRAWSYGRPVLRNDRRSRNAAFTALQMHALMQEGRTAERRVGKGGVS